MDTTSPEPRVGDDGPQQTGDVPPQRPTTGFFDSIRRSGLSRGDDRWIGGVCSGLAARTRLDPILVRGLFAVAVLLGGVGFVLYGLAWGLLPEQRDGRIHLEQAIAGRFDPALGGAIAFVVLGAARGNDWLWPWAVPGWFEALAWLALMGSLIALVAVALNQHRPEASGAARPPSPWGPFPDVPTDPASDPTADGASDPGAGPATGWTSTVPSTPAAAPEPTTVPAWGAPTPPPPASWGPTDAAPPATLHHAGAVHAPVPPAWTPRRRGPGSTTVGIVLALALLGWAGILVAQRTGAFDGPVGLTALGLGVVLAGLGIVVAGLRGRRSGVLGFLAIVGLILASPLAVVRGGVDGWTWQGVSVIDDDTSLVVLRDTDTAERGVSTGLADLTVDLSGLDLDRDVDVPINAGAGNVVVIVPDDEDVTLRADVRAGAGSIEWSVGGDEQTLEGVGIRRHFERAGSTPQLGLDISVGAGDIRIEEAK